jgi:hypothetical protein
MEDIRECLMYKNSKMNICMKKHTPIEQYEIIRILIGAHVPENVTICKHESTNSYINTLIEDLRIMNSHC